MHKTYPRFRVVTTTFIFWIYTNRMYLPVAESIRVGGPRTDSDSDDAGRLTALNTSSFHATWTSTDSILIPVMITKFYAFCISQVLVTRLYSKASDENYYSVDGSLSLSLFVLILIDLLNN